MGIKLVCVKCEKVYGGTENINPNNWICPKCKWDDMIEMTLEEYEVWTDELKRRNSVYIPEYIE